MCDKVYLENFTVLWFVCHKNQTICNKAHDIYANAL